MVAIAGAITHLWSLLSVNLFEALEHRSYIYRLTPPGWRFLQHTTVRPATLGFDAGLADAALYPFIYRPEGADA